jgi:Sec-independent protein secretion pathway component TatC
MQEESFMSHLTELRDRVVRALLVVVVFFGLSFYFARKSWSFWRGP